MSRTLFHCLLLLLVSTPNFPPVYAAEPAPNETLTTALRAQAMPLELTHGRLRGPGANWLRHEAEQSQFVLIGEDHGMADLPQFATALWQQHAPRAFRHLVIETGPFSSAVIETAARDGEAALATLNASYPSALPFFGWREEGALAIAAVTSSAHAPTLWGIDQEFILSGRMLFRRLAELAPDATARRLADDHATRDDAAYRQMVARHDSDSALLPKLTAKDYEKLRKAFSSATQPEARELIDALEESTAIYRSQNDAPYDSNAARSALMKRIFMARYRAALATEAQPRVMFKLGAFHAGRGLSPAGLFDIGNLASELAASNGSRSLHVLVIAAGGESFRWFPFAPEPASKRAPYNAREELGGIGALPALEAADRKQWTLFPLARFRTEKKLRAAGGAAFERLVFGYDAIVVIPAAHAATMFGDDHPTDGASAAR